MSILQNAIDSIQIGVEDFNNPDTKRHLSSIRNITAGLLLLYKQKLCELSPSHDKELLIKKDIKPCLINGSLFFKGYGKKTVDVYDIKDKFKSLSIHIDTGILDQIINIRNQIEHYYTTSSDAVIREVITKSFVLIRDFIRNELNKDPISLLGNNCWRQLLDVSEVYNQELKSCRDSYEQIEWQYETIHNCLDHIRCPKCHSELVSNINGNHNTDTSNMELKCCSCGHNFQFEEILEDILATGLYGETYEAIMNGSSSPIETCPECFHDSYVHAEGCCLICNYQQKHCCCKRCGEEIDLSAQDCNGYCGYCHYQYEKTMRE